MRRPIALLAFCILPLVAYGDPGSDQQANPSPGKTLKKVVRTLTKEKNYQVELNVQGGFANGADHAIPAPRVMQSYKADYYRGYLNLPEPRVIRNAKKGAIRSGTDWMQLLAVREGALVERLFHFPNEILLDAAQKGGKVEWIGATTKKVVEGDGHTGVARDVVVTPNRLRVEVPSKVSQKRYTTIQNSGCTSAG